MCISIIIPSYNRANLLERTLESIKSQSSPDWECIVVDDFSNDNTNTVVSLLMRDDSRISYYLNEHKKGAQGARNTGLDHAKYDWVIFFDSDNIMHHDFVEKMQPNLTDNIDVCACCSDFIDIDKGPTGEIMNPHCYGHIHDNLFSGSSYVDFNHSVIRKSRLVEIGCLDEDCPSMQEWDTHIRLSKICNYSMIEESLIDYYVGGKDAISSDKKREVVGRLYILKKHIDEWKDRPISITRFAYQIYRLIMMKTDKNFRDVKLAELEKLVPFWGIRVRLCNVFAKIARRGRNVVQK